ncbi:MAG: glycosyltransferase family 1 protein [Planctomycetes bacterium]|nr:glycosyltransferase family 1 protein [Planctomycetota bacterium]
MYQAEHATLAAGAILGRAERSRHAGEHMGLRILVADTYYDAFLAEYERANADAADLPYRAENARLMARHFGTGDAYAAGFRSCGCEAETVVLNARSLQNRWAREHNVPAGGVDARWDPNIFIAQVRDLRPDVLFVQELSVTSDEVLDAVKPFAGMIVGQIACSLPAKRTFAPYDLIVSSWPPIVDYFRENGKPAEWCPLGFDSSVAAKLANEPTRYDVTFVGGLGQVHSERIALLEYLCRHLRIDVFGYGLDTLPQDSPIRSHHHGTAWGIDAYRALAASAITVNAHGTIEVPGDPCNHLANNCRLFEATGVGTLLLTDWKENLGRLFGPGVEVATYTSADECLERIRYFLDRRDELQTVARAGQRRTLAEHTYNHRAQTLLELFAASPHAGGGRC